MRSHIPHKTKQLPPPPPRKLISFIGTPPLITAPSITVDGVKYKLKLNQELATKTLRHKEEKNLILVPWCPRPTEQSFGRVSGKRKGGKL
jgi:hypothetical protein